MNGALQTGHGWLCSAMDNAHLRWKKCWHVRRCLPWPLLAINTPVCCVQGIEAHGAFAVFLRDVELWGKETGEAV